MKEPSDQGLEETPSAEERPEVDTPSVKKRIRGAFGFLRAPSFWGGLVVGLVALGVGVAIGLGTARWMDDDRGRDSDDRGQFTVRSFRVDPSREWDTEGRQWPGDKRFRFRFPAEKPGDRPEEWEKKDWEDRRWEKEFEPGGVSPKDFYLTDEVLELVERFIDAIEELIDEVGDYLERGGFDRSGDGPFGPARFFEDDFWKNFEGRLFGDEDRKGYEESEIYPEGAWDEGREGEGFWDEEEGPLGGLRFPFGEFLPGFTFLEDCELDLMELPSVLEGLPDEGGGLGDDESLEEFFAQIEELFREACEQPSDG